MQDKATKRFMVRNMVDASTKRDIMDNSAIPNYEPPKLYVKTEYCVSCAIHSHIVHVRSTEERRVREAPARVRPRN
jgi:small subunit ribosomal protein S26e